MSRPLPLALAQVSGRRGDDLDGFAASASQIVRLFPATELLVYPELHLATDDADPLDERAVLDSAQPLTAGPRHEAFATLAAGLGVWLCPGSVSELGDDGSIYNTAVVYAPDGSLAASYRKVFPWRPFEPARPGSAFVVFDMPGTGRIGLSICYDAWFPESTRHLAWLGAELVLNVVKTGTVDREQEVVLARANATVNQVFVASVNASTPSGLGHSVLVGPEGNVLSELPGTTAGVLTGVVDLDVVTNARRYGSFGFTRPWSQVGADDPPISLPLYGGEITAERWSRPSRPGDQPNFPVTAANWQERQNIAWSFQHVDEVLPVAAIAHGAPAPKLERAPLDLSCVRVDLPGGRSWTADRVVAATDTGGLLVLHGDKLVVEEYRGGMTPSTRHLLQSVSTSLVSTVVGALAAAGAVDLDTAVGAHAPELAGSGYADATVRQLLDMRSGIGFREDYVDPASDSRVRKASVGWAPAPPGAPRSMKAFLAGLQQVRPHGGPFEYRSCETDVLGWVCEAATGRRFADLASDLVWSRTGARHDAYVTVDAEGTAVVDGGMCATLGDLAAFGAMVLRRGTSLTGQQVVPGTWIDDIFCGRPDSDAAFAPGPLARRMPGGAYRNAFWFPSASREVALGIGIHGQLVYLDRASGVVGVKLSSWPSAEDGWKSLLTLRMFEAIAVTLTRRAG